MTDVDPSHKLEPSPTPTPEPTIDDGGEPDALPGARVKTAALIFFGAAVLLLLPRQYWAAATCITVWAVLNVVYRLRYKPKGTRQAKP